MSFIPEFTLKQLSNMAGFHDLDELARYASTSKQNLHNWNKNPNRQAFLQVVIVGAKVMKAQAIKAEAQRRAAN